MKKLIFVSILLLAGFLLAANGMAQQQQTQQSQTLQSEQSPQEKTSQQQQASQPGQQLRWAQKSSDILDKKIISKDGKELGTAKDLIIGKDGKIEYIILSTGGLFGIGGEKVAVPWDKVRSTPNIDQLVADVSQSEIQRYAEGKEKSKESGKDDSKKMAQSDRKESSMSLAEVDSERAKEFMDKTVKGKDGEELGKMTDLFTSEDGKPMYVVVQDESERLHPVPAQLIRTNPDDKNLSADLDRQAFQSSPSFEKAQISQQEQWEPKVRGYYQSGFQGGQSGRQLPPPGAGQPGFQQPPPQQPPQGMGESGQQQPPPGRGQLQDQ